MLFTSSIPFDGMHAVNVVLKIKLFSLTRFRWPLKSASLDSLVFPLYCCNLRCSFNAFPPSTEKEILSRESKKGIFHENQRRRSSWSFSVFSSCLLWNMDLREVYQFACTTNSLEGTCAWLQEMLFSLPAVISLSLCTKKPPLLFHLIFSR